MQLGLGMTTATQRALKDLKDVTKTLKGLIDEVHVQVHLGAADLKDNAGPYLDEVRSASRLAARELVKEGRQLSATLKKIRKEHRAR